jgi:hypothetical protein
VRADDLFGLKLSNIPTINLRMEFNRTYGYVFSDAAGTALKPPIQAVEAPMFVWLGMPDDLMTLLLQRAILGVEAYLPAALKYTSAQLGVASKELFAKLDDPFSLGGRTVASNIYHRMPAAVHAELSLQYLDQELFDKTLRFYKSVRNPLFHGQQLHDTDIEALRRAFDHIARIYEWIDYWHNPEHHIKGGSEFAGIRNRYRAASPKDAPSPWLERTAQQRAILRPVSASVEPNCFAVGFRRNSRGTIRNS